MEAPHVLAVAHALAGRDLEPSAMAFAAQRVVGELAARQRIAVLRARVLEREDLVAEPHQDERTTAHQRRTRASVGELGDQRGIEERHADHDGSRVDRLAGSVVGPTNQNGVLGSRKAYGGAG